MLPDQTYYSTPFPTARGGNLKEQVPVLFARFFSHNLLRLLPIWCFCVLMALSGCAGHQTILSPLDDALNENSAEEAANELLQRDSQGELPSPNIPPELMGEIAGDSGDIMTKTLASPIEYSVICESPDDPRLAATFLQISTLMRMQERPIHSFTALEQRLGSSLQEGREILHSFGYYTGQVHGDLDIPQDFHAEGQPNEAPARATVTVHFTPGPQYTLGNTIIAHPSQRLLDAGEVQLSAIMPAGAHSEKKTASRHSTVTPAPQNTVAGQPKDEPKEGTDSPYMEAVSPMAGRAPLPKRSVALLYDFHPDDAPPLPRALGDVGLDAGSPAQADDILNAVDRVRERFRNSGYPKARITSTRYFLNHQNKTLDVEIHILPGSFMRMGEISLPQEASVDKNYLLAKQTWEKGEAWNQKKIDVYHDQLRQTGLFVSISIEPGVPEDNTDIHSVDVALAPAPERTIGGSLKYDTSFGPGVQAFWEHRNLTGNGDSLRFELPVWMDMQELTAKYRLPFFQRDDQDFIAQLGILNQDLDAYNLQAARIAMGIDRRLSRHWKLTVQGSAEGGSLKDPKKPREEYLMYGMPVNIAFDSTNSLLDATKGGRASLNLAPYIGEYRDDFTVLRSRLDLHRFVPLTDDKSLVLALRGTVGTMSGGDAQRVPPSVRFYSGGGGSVRGYEYQSLGPRNYRDDPLGGSALTELTIEPRWRFSETFGVVAFVDGGMAHEDIDDLGKDLRWGAGVGFRMYTPIGPVRFDVATPLTPRDDDEAIQFYISIGQSF